MRIYVVFVYVHLVWAKTNVHHGIPKDFDPQDIKDVFFKHPHRDSKGRSSREGGKLAKADSSTGEQLIAGKFSPTGWVTKCRGVECISTSNRNNAGNFLNKALDVLDKYSAQKSKKYHPTKKPDRTSPNSLATLLATTSGIIGNHQEEKSSKFKSTKTETKKSHGKMENVYETNTKRQGWFEGNPGMHNGMVNGIGNPLHLLPGHHNEHLGMNTIGMHYHEPFGSHLEASPVIHNIGMHEHGFYQPHGGMHKSIHVMDPSYANADYGNTGNVGTIAHFHQPLPFPVVGPSIVHGHNHFHPPAFPIAGLNPPVVHHHHATTHINLNEPVVHLNQNPNMLLDGPVPPYPEVPISGPMPGIHGLPVNHVPVPVPVPGPPEIHRIPVPVPGPPEVRPVMIPVNSPPVIEKVPVPVPVSSPPQIHNVPVPVAVPVPSPPQIKEVPYPVRIPVKQSPIIQRYFYPVGVPQPGQVHHVPYPIYIRQPPEVQPVPYPVRIQSPPEKVPIPVPSKPEVFVQRVPYPVIIPQPGPIHELHHHHHHQHYIVTQNGHCNVNPCINGGTCTAFEDSYKCHCQDGFKGLHCEEQSKCHPNPCRNLGTCTEVEKDYECTCQPGYKGTNCEITDPCSPSPCKNGGTCAEVGSSYTCDCRIGWIGKDCGIEAKCLPINPCQNGGTCTEALGSYHCNCMSGWQGLSCEISVPDPSTDSFQPRGGCNNCDPQAYCEDNTCVCPEGYLGDGYTCDFVPQTIHDKRVLVKKLMRSKINRASIKPSNKRHQVPKLRTRHATKGSKKQVHPSNS